MTSGSVDHHLHHTQRQMLATFSGFVANVKCFYACEFCEIGAKQKQKWTPEKQISYCSIGELASIKCHSLALDHMSYFITSWHGLKKQWNIIWRGNMPYQHWEEFWQNNICHSGESQCAQAAIHVSPDGRVHLVLLIWLSFSNGRRDWLDLHVLFEN